MTGTYNHRSDYLVYLLDAEGHVTRCHTIMAASHDMIIRKAASLYRNRPVAEIWAGDPVVACLAATAMSVIDSQLRSARAATRQVHP